MQFFCFSRNIKKRLRLIYVKPQTLNVTISLYSIRLAGW
ncbi:hypothetical protein BAXH7_02967 [Bacillus amyloliquefaciens XH7]|nr:hypothetical protein BAXH7_02967 [Bacillus amyloliquefaciens XH7]KYC93504.1 hypothetical protein B425_2938 [Bacillus amyloliquefaciens]